MSLFKHFLSRAVILNLIAVFIIQSFASFIIPVNLYASTTALPVPGTMLELSKPYMPVTVKGVIVHPENPFKFDFLVDSGDTGYKGEALKAESLRLIKYFLAALTTPEKDMWVNLSPYEKNRMIPKSFGDTEMGRDLLAQDYILKQLTASLTFPEKEMGKKFWDKVYSEAQAKFGTSNIPVNTFNKVWIMPSIAKVYEHNNGAYVVDSRLKVMLEEDYLALNKNSRQTVTNTVANKGHALASEIVREIIIPALEKEVNEGAHFATLRQIYQSIILATWYKIRLKDNILSKQYVDQHKTAGVNIDDKQANEKIYRQYLQAFKKGVYNYIKEDKDSVTQEPVARKYVSGGDTFLGTERLVDGAITTNLADLNENEIYKARGIKGNSTDVVWSADPALTAEDEARKVKFEADEKDYVTKREAQMDARLAPIKAAMNEQLGEVLFAAGTLTAAGNPWPVVTHEGVPMAADPFNNMGYVSTSDTDHNLIFGISGIKGITNCLGQFIIKGKISKERLKEVLEKRLDSEEYAMPPEELSTTSNVLFFKETRTIINTKFMTVSTLKTKDGEEYTQVQIPVFYNVGSTQTHYGNEFTDGVYPTVQGSLVEPSKWEGHPEMLGAGPRIAINGFGRTGRTILAALLPREDIQDMEIFVQRYPNEVVGLRALIDSVHGMFPGDFKVKEFGAEQQNPFANVQLATGEKLLVGLDEEKPTFTEITFKKGNVQYTRKIFGFRHEGPKGAVAPWGQLGIDIVVDATGKAKDVKKSQPHIDAGAKFALITAPADGMFTLVNGLTNQHFPLGIDRCSNGSCTTGAFAPQEYVHSKTGDILGAMMLTIHALTSSQALTDGNSWDKDGANALLNLILTTTGASKAAKPALETAGVKTGPFDGLSLRIGTAAGSASTARTVVYSEKELTAEIINEAATKLSQGELKGILAVSDSDKTSGQIIGRSESSIFYTKSTRVQKIAPNLYVVTTVAWYDNEWGYSTRIGDALYVVWAKMVEARVRNYSRSLGGVTHVKDLDIKEGDEVAVRVDFNVPIKNGQVTDDTRIREFVESGTYQYLKGKGAKIILMAHLGRPPKEIKELIKKQNLTAQEASEQVLQARDLKPVYERLKELLGDEMKVNFANDSRTMRSATPLIDQMQPGEGLLLNNVRFNENEEADWIDPKLAADLFFGAKAYVNEGFAVSHRGHASVVGAPADIPHAMGYLVEKELKLAEMVKNETDLLVMGGSKVSDKIKVIKTLLDARPDRRVLIGGAMANAFLKAKGFDVGASIGAEDAEVKIARQLMEQYGDRVQIPEDVIAVDNFDRPTLARNITLASDVVPKGWTIVDIGEKTQFNYFSMIYTSKFTFWNGPMGAFDKLPREAGDGSKRVAEAIAMLGERAAVGGGDSVAAFNQYIGKESKVNISTGGGAFLELLEKGTLPGVEFLLRPTLLEKYSGDGQNGVVRTWLEALLSGWNNDPKNVKISVPKILQAAEEQARANMVGIKEVILAVYDNKEARNKGEVSSYNEIARQVLIRLAGLTAEEIKGTTIAYNDSFVQGENDLERIRLFIRGLVFDHYGPEVAKDVRILSYNETARVRHEREIPSAPGAGGTDQAVLTDKNGGIDLQRKNINLQITGNDKAMINSGHPWNLVNFNIKYGLSPTILEMKMNVNVSMFLGLGTLPKKGANSRYSKAEQPFIGQDLLM